MERSARNASPIAPTEAAGLADVPFFRFTERARLAELARLASLQHVRAGGIVLARGSRPRGLMVVSYGVVKLTLAGPKRQVLRLVGPAQTFAEAALFLDRPLPVEASAVSDAAVLIVPSAPLFRLLESDPRFARGIIASVCERLQMLVAELEAASGHGAAQRLAAYLAALPGAGEALVELPAPKSLIASRLGMTRETLSRLLRAFIDAGLIEVSGRRVRVGDAAGLAATAAGASGPSAPA